MNKIEKLILCLVACLSLILIGCAHLVAGADPIVVRAEQVESGATNTLTLIVSIDDAERKFWMTNAPPFHKFAESLREPMIVDGISLPRALAAVKQLDDVKLAYKTGAATSNDLVAITTTLSATLSQASAWLTIVSNTPAH